MKEIIIICPNQPGAVADISAALGDRGINILSFDASGARGDGIVILQTDHYDEALQVLTAAGFQAFSEEAALIKIEDRPGALARVALRLKEASINLKSLRIVRHGEGFCLAAIVAEDQAAMRAVLADIIIQSEA